MLGKPVSDEKNAKCIFEVFFHKRHPSITQMTHKKLQIIRRQLHEYLLQLV